MSELHSQDFANYIDTEVRSMNEEYFGNTPLANDVSKTDNNPVSND